MNSESKNIYEFEGEDYKKRNNEESINNENILTSFNLSFLSNSKILVIWN